MGVRKRPRPKLLGQKLLAIREALGLSQNEILDRLGLKGELMRQNISDYESNRREPSLLTILAYAQIAGVCTDTLIDDAQNLPKKIPSKATHR